MKRSTAIARTRRRLPREKSTSARSIGWLPPGSLLDGVLEDQGVRHHALPWPQARHDFLQVVREGVAAPDLDTLKLTRPDGHVHPFAIMEVEDGGCRNHRPSLLRLTAERRGYEHANAHETGIGDLDAHLGGPETRIEDRANIADATCQDLVGIGCQVNVGGITDTYR